MVDHYGEKVAFPFRLQEVDELVVLVVADHVDENLSDEEGKV
jgi:hypothetical protein